MSPGATDTYALGINDSGLVAGYWDLLDADGNTLAVYGFYLERWRVYRYTDQLSWCRGERIIWSQLTW
jgi:hypothetical protein